MKKKILILAFMLSFLSFLGISCNKKIIYSDDPIFLEKESDFKLKKDNAINIYNNNFINIFDIIKDENFENRYTMVLYLKKEFYYIGYKSNLDKRDIKTAPLYFLARIDSQTGKIEKVDD